MNKLALASGAALATAVAFLAGRWSAPVPEPSPPVRPPVEPDSPVERTIERIEIQPDASCEEELEALRQRLALAEGIIDAQIKAQTGTPEEFPEGLEPQYTPEGFENAVLEAMEGCPGIEVELAFTDCGEFPCMAFFSQPEGGYNHAIGKLRNCESWRNRFAPGGQANHSFMTDQGKVEYSMASPRPPGWTGDENSGTRWNYRLEQGRTQLMDMWGGREPTPLEEVESSLVFWNRLAEDPDWPEGEFDDTIAELEAQRATLLAEEQ
jgi:hypothetical protein